MLFQINKKFSKKFLFTFLKNNDSFFVFNVRTYKESKILYNVFMGNVLHSKQMSDLFLEKHHLSLFGGNSVFCFVKNSDFFQVYLNIIYDLDKYGLDLIGICYNNYLLNLNLNYSNVISVLYSNFVVVFFLVCVFINLFFFKLLLLLKKTLSSKKC
jgi:hypothetical protein